MFESWLAADMDIRVLYQEQFLCPYAVGELWETRADLAWPPASCWPSWSCSTWYIPRLFDRPRNGKSVVVACITNHQMGKMVADLFAMQGWRADFLGANTPLPGLLELIRR